MTTFMKMVPGSGSAKNKYHHTAEVVDTTTDPLIVENTGNPVLIAVVPGSGATVQASLSPLSKVQDGTANWFDWPAGDVMEPTQDSVASGVTALRLVSTGTSTWEVVA